MPILILLLLLCVSFANAEGSTKESASILIKARQAAADNQWASAERLYHKAKVIAVQQGNTQDTLDILFSLLTVYQQQSDGVAAFKIAAEIEQLAINLSDPFSLTRSYRLLGIAYQSLANNELARDYYSVAVESSRELNKPALLASLLNELGYADVLVADFQSAKASFEESFMLARSVNDQKLMLQAQINLLRIQIALGDKKKIKKKFALLDSLLLEIPESEKLVNDILSLGTLYRSAQIKLKLNSQYRKTAYQQYERGLKLAIKYQNMQLQSIANGYIGQLYSDEAQYEIAGRFTQEAILIAQSLNNVDLIYRWTVQLGRILSAQGNRTSALKQYQRAVELLDSLDIVNFMRYERSFNADVKPVFDEMFVLLFQQVRNVKDTSKRQTKLNKIIYYAEKLRIKELAAFCFGNCNFKQQDKKIALFDNEAILYTLVLDKHFHVLLKSNSGINYKTHSVSRNSLLSKLKKLTRNIQKSKLDKSYLKQAKQFHKWMISPFSEILKQENISTISFIPSQELMKLPIGILYAKNKYLIENYAVKFITTSNDLSNVSRWKYSAPNYHLMPLKRHDSSFVLEDKNNIVLKSEDLPTLKNIISKFESGTMLSVSNSVTLANDYRQSRMAISDANLPLFSVLNKVNSGKPLGALVVRNNNPDKMNNLYFNAQLINVTYVISPLWAYSQPSNKLLLTQFYTSVKSGLNVEKALQQAKISLIRHKTLRHPINWAGLLVLQH